PDGFEPDAGLYLEAERRGRVRRFREPREAATGADVVYTDTWTSMGQEDEAEWRRVAFAGYQVDAKLMSLAKPDALFLHCLPAHRGEEVTPDVIDGPQSVVIEQAENRLHLQKALMNELVLANLARRGRVEATSREIEARLADAAGNGVAKKPSIIRQAIAGLSKE